MDAIASGCNNFLDFLQAVSVKTFWVEADPLSLRTDKRESNWFRRWSSHHLDPLTTPLIAAPQDQSGLMLVLSDVTIRIQNS